VVEAEASEFVLYVAELVAKLIHASRSMDFSHTTSKKALSITMQMSLEIKRSIIMLFLRMIRTLQ